MAASNGGLKLPPDVSRSTLQGLLNEANARALLLNAKIQQFQGQYGVALEDLEARLDRGEGNEHPDWEDSLEWRTAIETLSAHSPNAKLTPMATDFEHAVARFVADCKSVTAINELVTKVRIELAEVYVLDLYYNETIEKYSYTLVKADQRIIGWDNARHHPTLSNFPHHLHLADGTIQPSTLTGAPLHDLEVVRLIVEQLLSAQL